METCLILKLITFYDQACLHTRTYEDYNKDIHEHMREIQQYLI